MNSLIAAFPSIENGHTRGIGVLSIGMIPLRRPCLYKKDKTDRGDQRAEDEKNDQDS